ncbi:MAG: type I restriction enzyme HsdR N-terminal domain-containing protein [Simkaniaceae bacterium]|nr:type I restriction enzyme HsdR N-terminal domain-containing protein [Simkaniaceae bacterium]MCF7851636.1 type I restriction enzyme HsdR N-terminal domain-containing protein [Simkaniaceae bacterium]
MDSSNRNNQLFDPFRKKWVIATPEECVRQGLLRVMTDQGGYPKSLIAIERGIQGLKTKRVNRRFDIICYHPSGSPLLLIECKAEILNEATENQVIGYNTHVIAPFIAIAGRYEVRMGRYDVKKHQWVFSAGLPPFASLVKWFDHV